MENKKRIYPTKINYSYDNEELHKVFGQLENIIKDLNEDKAKEIIVNQIENIMTTIKNIIKQNDDNNQKIKKIINDLNFEYDKTKKIDHGTVYKTKVYDDGKYIGEFKNNLREGNGTMLWFDGARYEGSWKKDKTEGKGIIYYNDGARYEGDFKNNKVEGRGIMYLSDGSRYEGEFKDGNMEGKGIIYDLNGDREMGDFLNNEKVGKHVLLHSNGKISTQDWTNK